MNPKLVFKNLKNDQEWSKISSKLNMSQLYELTRKRKNHITFWDQSFPCGSRALHQYTSNRKLHKPECLKGVHMAPGYPVLSTLTKISNPEMNTDV